MLTVEQIHCLTALQELVVQNHPWLCIEGPAGTGKSTVIKQFCEDTALYYKALRKVMPNAEMRPIYLTATTNKAANALAHATGMPTQTIHSLLGGRMFKGKMYYNVPKLSLDNAVVVIDEYTYIDAELFKAIKKHVTKTTSVVFIGDPCQLTPVGMDYLPVKDAHFPTVTLTKVVRQETEVLLDTANQCREYVTTGKFPELEPDGKSLVYYGEDEDSFIDALIAANKQGVKPKFISYSNARVQAVNKFLKEELTDSPKFKAGDVGIVNRHYEGRSKGTSVKVDTALTVKKATDRTVTLNTVKGTFNVPSQQIETSDGRQFLVADNYEDFVKFAELHNGSYTNAASLGFAQSFLDLRPEYACTVHKAQGSTYEETFIDLSDFSTIRDEETLARLLYVAMTRSRKKIHLIGSL